MIHYVDAEADFHRVFGGEIIRIAQRLREEGRIRHIGISSHNPAVARMAVETGLVDVLMFSVNPCYDLQPAGDDVEALWAEESYAGALRNIDPDRERLYELCERTGVGIDAMKVYGGGDLLNAENSPFGKAMTPVQCIEYALTRPGVASVMVGCRTKSGPHSTGAAHRPPKGTMPPQWPAWSGLPGKGIACTAAIAPPVRRE